MHQEGPSRARSRSRPRHGGRIESDSDSAPDADLSDRPWEHIVSTVRLRVDTIREKYYIPPSYEILVPSSADRMHRPPRGFCSFSLNHFDAGLIFVRPPPGRGWPFCCEWVLEKPKGDQIRSLSSNRYDPKMLLVEEVLRLAQLSPAPIPVEGSLDDMVGQSRLAQRIRANRARPSAGEAAPAPSSATSPRPVENSVAPPGNRPHSPRIDIWSEDTRSHIRPLNQPVPASPDRSHTGESNSGGLLTRRRRGMEMLNDVSDCWRKAREDLRAPNHLMPPPVEEKFVPNWMVSPNSTVLGSHSGQVSWELYNAACLPRDQAALLQSPFTRLEEHAAHSLVQAANLVHGLSLKCAGFRRNQLVAERLNSDMRLKIREVTTRAENSEAQRAILEARIKELEEKIASEVSKANESGREAGFAAGHAAGKAEGRAEFLSSDEFSARIREARLSGARDFIRAPSFDTALEIRAADYLVQGFDRCKAQVSTLKGFVPDFDLAKLDPSLDGNM
ncbi:UNVERIFIED_CONTAM: hypothetical protein Sindi_2283600 [Sesamum indicum]